MKILITGGAGFIGSHIADRCIARGDDVLVIDNYATGRRDNLTAHQRLTVVDGTIADRKQLAACFERALPSVVVHAAASYKDPDNWVEDAATNVMGSANVAQLSKRHGVARLIYFQTALCYGLRPDEQPITITHPVRPDGSSYAVSKTAGEQYVSMCGVPALSFRLANAYGPRNLSGPLPTFFQRLSQGKACFVMNTRRDFIFVDDLVEVVMRAIDGVGRPGAYHVSSGGDCSIQELFDVTCSAMGLGKIDVEVRERNPDDAFSILLDPSKTNSDFDWKTTTPLSAGIPRTIEYYRKFGLSETFTHLRLEGK